LFFGGVGGGGGGGVGVGGGVGGGGGEAGEHDGRARWEERKIKDREKRGGSGRGGREEEGGGRKEKRKKRALTFPRFPWASKDIPARLKRLPNSAAKTVLLYCANQCLVQHRPVCLFLVLVDGRQKTVTDGGRSFTDSERTDGQLKGGTGKGDDGAEREAGDARGGRDFFAESSSKSNKI